MATRYYEITIRPMSGGMWQAQPRQGEGWGDVGDLLAEMANCDYRLVDAKMAEDRGIDIDWPGIVNEPGRVYALIDDNDAVVGYCGIEERDE